MQVTPRCGSELSCGSHHTAGKIQESYSSMQGPTGSEPCPPAWSPAHSPTPHSGHSCLFTVHKHIIAGAFSSVFSLLETCIAKILVMASSTSSFIGPCPRAPENPPITLFKESAHCQSNNPLIHCTTHLFLKAFFLFIYAHIY